MKWIARIILLGIVVSIIFGVSAYFYLKGAEIPSDAHYGVQCYYEDDSGNRIPTRIYYAEDARLKDGHLLLENYWTFDGERYNKGKGIKELPPPYEIILRKPE